MFTYVRRKVSLNKIRYTKDGFDLDLTYITPNVVAMGFPATGVEAFYRNPRPQVQKLLEKLHKDKYKVYNLCAEPKWSYSPDVFHQRVGRYPFHDHQAPPLELMGQFCKDVEEWLAQDPDNIAAVHCKAGKGRAGMMICCWLIHSKTYPDAEEAMKQYGSKRTRDGKGVTIPSQRRYVRYYQDIVNYGQPSSHKIKIKNIFFQTSNLSNQEIDGIYIDILVAGKNKIFESKPQKIKAEDLTVTVDTEVEGDIKVNLYDSLGNKKHKPICSFWFNTSFISGNVLELKRIQIDKAWNDKKFKVFKADFDIRVEFEGAEVSEMDKLIKEDRKQKRKDSRARKSHESGKSQGKKEKKEKKEKKDKQEQNGIVEEKNHDNGNTKEDNKEEIQEKKEENGVKEDNKKENGVVKEEIKEENKEEKKEEKTEEIKEEKKENGVKEEIKEEKKEEIKENGTVEIENHQEKKLHKSSSDDSEVIVISLDTPLSQRRDPQVERQKQAVEQQPTTEEEVVPNEPLFDDTDSSSSDEDTSSSDEEEEEEKKTPEE
eukprot:TRINITY_DN2856_c0_g1_i1.p1 TRINITY_DN2856_c0_g1~~TRINITY_DN2856_c0_g1_i1.p1  ORF type:complete len:542 (-),score=190.67 TRINITY_DN2856_c0_g1_i1:74-1699(-)